MSIARCGKKRIGIIRAGVAGLHLALRSRQASPARSSPTALRTRSLPVAQPTPSCIGRQRYNANESCGACHWPTGLFGFDQMHKPARAMPVAAS